MEKIKFIRLLQQYSENNPIVVEGKRDKEVLQELRIKNVYAVYEIRRIPTKKFKEVLILTDRDRKGKKIYKYLYNYFISEGLIINNKLRELFFRMFGVVRVEELKNRMNDIKHILEYEEITGSY